MYELLTSNFKTKNTHQLRQLVLLNLLTLVAGFGQLFFALFNTFVTNTPHIAFMNLLGVAVSIYIFVDLRFNKNLNRALHTGILGVNIFFILFIYFNQNEHFGLFWVFFAPIFTIGLLGVKKSLYYLIPYFLIILGLAYNGIGEWNNGEWSYIGFIRLLVSSLLVTLVAVMMDIALSHSYKNLEHLNATDELTNIYNRRKIQEMLSTEIERAKRYDGELGLILFDIDNFKQINDTVGHNAGDRVLTRLSSTIKGSLRKSDYFGRWGGEEFLIVTPQSNVEDTRALGEKIRTTITEMGCSVVDDLSCSFGVSTLNKHLDTPDTFIDRADKAMYRAKELGKNRVEVL